MVDRKKRERKKERKKNLPRGMFVYTMRLHARAVLLVAQILDHFKTNEQQNNEKY